MVNPLLRRLKIARLRIRNVHKRLRVPIIQRKPRTLNLDHDTMNDPKSQQEPSMEEILASIRRIISEEDVEEEGSESEAEGDTDQAQSAFFCPVCSSPMAIIELFGQNYYSRAPPTMIHHQKAALIPV